MDTTMLLDTNMLLIGALTGSIGTGYFIYGKNQQLAVWMLSGIALCIYPYFVDNIWILSIIGIILIVIPFFLNF